MSRDNVLWALAGVLVGFVTAYLLFETVGSRQPPRAVAVTPGAVAPATAPGGAPPAAGAEAERLQAMERQARDLETFLAANPATPEAWVQLANLRFDLQLFDGAAEAYARYLELAPANPDVLTDLGVSYRMVGRHQDALEQFRRARELAPDHWKALFNEVVVLAFDQRRLEEADQALDRLRELQPANPDVERLATEVGKLRGAA